MRVNPWTLFAITACLSLLSGCTTSRMKDEWRDPNYQRTSAAQKVFVLAVTTKPDRRRLLEEQFVQRLNKAGVDATSSYQSLPTAGPDNVDEVKQAVKKSGASLALIVRLVSVKQESAAGHGGVYGTEPLYTYYPMAHGGLYDPPEIYVYNVYRTEARAFDVKSEKMIWAGMLDTNEPKDFPKAVEDYADVVVKKMQKDKIVG